MSHVIVHTVEVDETQMPKKKAAINGGMFKKDQHSAQYPVIVIGVKNVDEAVKKAESSGGKVFKNKMAIGEMGFYAQIKDTEGNIIGIWGEK